MAKLPYGGIPEVWIDHREDPLPLLAEIAKCAFEGVAMRPALAIWFERVWRDGRVSVRPAVGDPRGEPLHRRLDAVWAVRRLIAKDSGPQRGKTARAAKLVFEQMKLCTESPRAIYGWIKDVEKIEESNRADFHEMEEQERLSSNR